MGGEVIYFGKPHKQIYSMIIQENEKILIIGDNLRTDIKGANLIEQDSLFILDGVHKNEIRESKNLNSVLEKYNVKTNFTQKQLNW